MAESQPIFSTDALEEEKETMWGVIDISTILFVSTAFYKGAWDIVELEYVLTVENGARFLVDLPTSSEKCSTVSQASAIGVDFVPIADK